jgi:hypothetical protein
MKPGTPSMLDLDSLDAEAGLEAMEGMVGQAMVGADGEFDFGLVAPGEYVLQGYVMNMDFGNLEDVESMMQELIVQDVVVKAGEPLYFELQAP